MTAPSMFLGPLIVRRAVVALAVATALVVVGCGGGTAEPDASIERDAQLADGSPIPPRDAQPFDAPPDDAAAGDGGAGHCAAGACDPASGDGCVGAEICVLRERLPACAAPADGGMLAEGESCAAEDACGPGLACFRDGSTGVCARPCCPGGADACGDGLRCSADGTLVNGIPTTWGRCAAPRACDPRMPACAEREGCYIRYPLPDGGVPAECLFAGTAGVGEDCARPEDCRPGFYCAGIDRPACVRVCDLADARSCPMDEGTCVAQAYSPEGTGVCVLPATAW